MISTENAAVRTVGLLVVPVQEESFSKIAVALSALFSARNLEVELNHLFLVVTGFYVSQKLQSSLK